MKLWLLANDPPLSADTAYLIGRVLSHCSQVFVTALPETAATAPAPPGEVDLILNRSFCTRPGFLRDMDDLAARLGVPMVNQGAATILACDKRSYLESYTDLVPETWIVADMDAVERLRGGGGHEIVLKGPFGKRGEEVIRYRGAADRADAETLFDSAPPGGIVAQRFCPGFQEGDKRVILHRRQSGGFEIVAWYARIPAPGGWKSNLSAGGRIEPCELTADERDLSMEVARRAGLDYIGIDIGRDGGHCLLIETNAYTGGHIDFDTTRPGAASGDDLARMLVGMARAGSLA